MKTAMHLLAISCLFATGHIAACLAADAAARTSEERDTLLYVRTEPTGATVRLDGKEIGKSNGLFPVEPGSGQIIVELEGHKTRSVRVTIQAKQITRVILALESEPTATIERPAASNRGDASQLSQQGWQLWQQGKSADAIPKFREAVKLAPATRTRGTVWVGPRSTLAISPRRRKPSRRCSRSILVIRGR